MKRTSKYIADRAKYKPYLFKCGSNWVAVDGSTDHHRSGASWVAIRKTPLSALNTFDYVCIPNDLIDQHLSSFGV